MNFSFFFLSILLFIRYLNRSLLFKFVSCAPHVADLDLPGVCIVSGSPGVCMAGFGVIQVTSGLTLGFRSSYWGPVRAWV